jgi:hypothetical protein
MNLFESSNPALVSVTDTDGPEQMLLPVAFPGERPMKTLVSQVHEHLQAFCNQSYVITNALFTDSQIFPQWLKVSRHWYPAILLGPNSEKPTLMFMSIVDSVENHRKHFNTVRDYYVKTGIDFNMVANHHFSRWDLVIERDNYKLSFASPIPLDLNFKPPFISVTQNDTPNQSPKPSIG